MGGGYSRLRNSIGPPLPLPPPPIPSQMSELKLPGSPSALMLPHPGMRLSSPRESEFLMGVSPQGVSHSIFAGRLHESCALAREPPFETASAPPAIRRMVRGMVSELFGGSAPMS